METDWPAQWLRGVLELCVLALVCRQETYGYAIARQLEEAGFGRIKGGTLYPILLRLEQDGLVTSTWREGDAGPGRKFFGATQRGHHELRERTTRWTGFVDVTHAVLHPAATDPSPAVAAARPHLDPPGGGSR
jgi:PadR family transcriptional regulator PadR